jgi:hypothetical protein
VRARASVAAVAGLLVVACSGLLQFGAPDDLAELVFGSIWLGLPFVPVWIAADKRQVVDRTLLIAFAVAALSTVVVHRVMQRSIEGNDSSTAAVIHIYDPVLGCLAVGIVLAAAWAIGRIRGRRLDQTRGSTKYGPGIERPGP